MVDINTLSNKEKENKFKFKDLYDNLDNCIAYITEKLKKGNICAFIGAGFSFNANKTYPDWSTLLIDAYKEMHPKKKPIKEIKDVIKKEHETKVAQQYVDYKGHRESIDAYIENKLSLIDNSSKNNLMIHKKLLQLNWADVITTNWDTLLEQADKTFGDYEVVKNAKDLRVNNHKRIVKVNGTLRTKEEIDKGEYCFDGRFDHLYIITENDFSTYEQKHNDFSNFMKVELLENSFCLFGFSGNDPNFQYWIKSLKGLMTKGGKTEEPNPVFMFTLDETKDNSIKQFYHNNYIVPIFIDKFVEIIRSEKPAITIRKSLASFKSVSEYPIPEKFSIILDYLEEKTKKQKEESLSESSYDSQPNKSSFISIVNRKTEQITDSQMESYNQTELFDFSNIKYTDYFIDIIRNYASVQKSYSEVFFEFLGRWLTSNYYSLNLLFSQNLAQKIVENYNINFVPKKKSLAFMEHMLRYYRETDETTFNKLYIENKNTTEFYNAVHYQKLLSLAQSFDYEEFQRLLEEWKPEESESEEAPLYILRKIYLLLLFENRNMISDCTSEIDNLLSKAENKCKTDSQLKYFIYELHSRILSTLSSEKLDNINKTRKNLSLRYVNFRQYLTALDFEKINQNVYKPNSDIRNRYSSENEEKINKNKIQISFVRILNFMEFIGCPAYEIIGANQFIDFSYLLKEYAGESTRLLLNSLSFFGNSSDEQVLRKILPLILRSRSKDYLNNLVDKILQIVKYKTDKDNRTPKVYIWFLYELIQRCSKNKINEYTSLFIGYIKASNEIIISLIQHGNVWGVGRPFGYAIEHVQNDSDYLFLLEYVMKAYLADEAKLKNIDTHYRSEFEQYYYAFFRNKSCINKLEKFFKQENIQYLLKKDAEFNCFLLQYAYEYLDDSCKLRNKTEEYLVKNMSLEIDPYILTKVTSRKITESVINTIKNYDFISWQSTYSNPVSFIKALNQINAFNDESKEFLEKIIKQKLNYLNSIEQNNEYITKTVTSAKISLFFMAKELELKDDFVKKLQLFYTESEKNTLNYSWLLKNTDQYKKGFEEYLLYCSYTEPKKLNLTIISICLSKILLVDTQINESVLENFVEIYIGNPLFSFLKTEEINKLLIMIMKKFKEDIPYYYDDLFITEQMQKLALNMRESGGKNEIIAYWVKSMEV